MVRITTAERSFCIDRLEATITRRGGRLSTEPAREAPPANRVSWHDANRACRGSGYRLCTSAEWTRACAGQEGRRFPYGDEYAPFRCNTAEWDTDLSKQAPRPGGSFPECVTPEGVFDLSGNLGEWVADADATGVLRRLHGGSFANSGDEGKYVQCEFDPPLHQPPDGEWDGMGFRCCRDVR